MLFVVGKILFRCFLLLERYCLDIVCCWKECLYKKSFWWNSRIQGYNDVGYQRSVALLFHSFMGLSVCSSFNVILYISESYENLVYKTLSGLKFFETSNLDFVIKMDDDLTINLQELM